MTTTLIRRPYRASVLEPTDFLGDFDRLFTGFLRPVAAEQGDINTGWHPTIDLRETDDAFILDAELPGMTKEDLELTLEEGVFTLSGERKFEGETAGKGYRHLERRFGSFSRSFTLPRDVASNKVVAAFENGLLTVTIPKAAQTKPRTIKIG
jgi:HSP20 family protein